jgi:hypothetical protein
MSCYERLLLLVAVDAGCSPTAVGAAGDVADRLAKRDGYFGRVGRLRLVAVDTGCSPTAVGTAGDVAVRLAKRDGYF